MGILEVCPNSSSDFTSKHIEQVCVDLKITLIFSQIAQPRGRGKIECFLRTLNQMLISKLQAVTQNGAQTKYIDTLLVPYIGEMVVIRYSPLLRGKTNKQLLNNA